MCEVLIRCTTVTNDVDRDYTLSHMSFILSGLSTTYDNILIGGLLKKSQG